MDLFKDLSWLDEQVYGVPAIEEDLPGTGFSDNLNYECCEDSEEDYSDNLPESWIEEEEEEDEIYHSLLINIPLPTNNKKIAYNSIDSEKAIVQRIYEKACADTMKAILKFGKVRRSEFKGKQITVKTIGSKWHEERLVVKDKEETIDKLLDRISLLNKKIKDNNTFKDQQIELEEERKKNKSLQSQIETLYDIIEGYKKDKITSEDKDIRNGCAISFLIIFYLIGAFLITWAYLC